jgi:hypothetical protein
MQRRSFSRIENGCAASGFVVAESNEAGQRFAVEKTSRRIWQCMALGSPQHTSRSRVAAAVKDRQL